MIIQFSSSTSPVEQDETKTRTQLSSPVILNEILPSPEGEDAKEEWVELFNAGNDLIDLSGWEITDTQGSVKIYVFPEGSQILGKEFLLLERPKTKITLNNDADGLQLIQKGNVVDSVQYAKAVTGQSFNRTQSGWIWSKALTPGSENIIASPKTKENKSKKITQQIEEQTEKKSLDIQRQTADITNQLPKNKFSIQFLSIASGIAIFSGIIMLFLKKKLER